MAKKEKYIPPDSIRRLSSYLRSLKRLEAEGVKIALSTDITKYLNISSDQLRKDLSYFGEFGLRGIGYNVKFLIKSIEKILGIDSSWNIALAGAGKLGTALIAYPGFSEFNFRIAAAFDNDSEKVGKHIGGVKIENIAKAGETILKNDIKIAILTVPAEAAFAVSMELCRHGIKAILNFSPVNLPLPGDVYVTNVDLAGELQGLSYKLKKLIT
jgi:redox-sensing transcriptional repressor